MFAIRAPRLGPVLGSSRLCQPSGFPALASAFSTVAPNAHNVRPKAVIFDVGGVLYPSPLPLLKEFEAESGIREGLLKQAFKLSVKNDGAFPKLERGELVYEDFVPLFEKEIREYIKADVDVSALFSRIHSVLSEPRTDVFEAIHLLRDNGIECAALTNNWRFGDNFDAPFSVPGLLQEAFNPDFVFESQSIGMRKPDPRIYEYVLKRMRLDPREAVICDDLQLNLGPPSEMGMRSIHVGFDYRNLIGDLEKIFGMKLKIKVPGTEAVLPAHRFEEKSLRNYFKIALPQASLNMSNVDWSRPWLVRQFKHGQSNPTFYIRAPVMNTDLAHEPVEVVLRKKPPGKLLKSAHMIEREFRVMSVMRQCGVPVPDPYTLCEDQNIIGTTFYTMQYLRGRVFRDPKLSEIASPSERQQIYDEMAKVLAQIHTVDWQHHKLQDYGHVDGQYVRRQISRWSKQYRASIVDEASDDMNSLMDSLPELSPDAEQTTIVHGDYRLGNLMYHPTEPRVIGVLDWELSTLGNPLSDVSYCAMPYHLPPNFKLQPGLVAADLAATGIPTQDEFLKSYYDRAGISPVSAKEWGFYMSYSFFRTAAILQGVYKRALDGNASSSYARSVGVMVDDLAAIGKHLLREGGSTNLPKTSPAPPIEPKIISTESGNILHRHVPSAIRSLLSPLCWEMYESLTTFMDEHVYPIEMELNAHARSVDKWTIHPIIETLKAKSKAKGLWNLFLPLDSDPSKQIGAGLSNLEYAVLCEIMGRSIWAPELFNCNAPDTGNMEILFRYGTQHQKETFLAPIVDGSVRSCFAMTEPTVASSDATNIQASITADGDDHLLLNGRKWWTSGAMDPRCEVCIFMGKSTPDGEDVNKWRQQSMVIVPMKEAIDNGTLKIVRPLRVMGYDDAPHGHAELVFENVRVPKENVILGLGRGFEIAQGRLGPGRIHHCMRLIGMAERAYEVMCNRTQYRQAFGKPLADHGGIRQLIAKSRCEIEQARLLTLQAAHMMDTVGNKEARAAIGMIKIVAPNMALNVIDRAIQVNGALGLCEDTPLAQMWSWARALRLADGPDEVHMDQLARLELKRFAQPHRRDEF